MGRGIDATLDWPVIKTLPNGAYEVDTGSRLRVRQRKRFKLKKDADALAAEIRAGHKLSNPILLTPRQRDEYNLAVSTLGDQYKKVGLVDVVEFYLKMQGVSAISKKVREVVPLFISSRKKKAERYVKQLQFVLGAFSDLFGDRKPAEITKDELEAFINGPRMSKRDPSKAIADTTRHNLHRAICAFYKFCWKKQWILENPMQYVDAPEAAALDPKILTIDDAKKLLEFVAAKHCDMLGFFALSLFCGIRVQELCRMKVSDLQLESYDSKYYAIVSKDVAKRKRPRNIPIPFNGYLWLNYWQTHARIPVGPNRWNDRRDLRDSDNIVPVSEASVFYRTKLVAKESGITLPQNVLRHSFASYYFATTTDAAQTRARLGHETIDLLFKHYAQLVKRDRHPIEYFKLLPPDRKWDDVLAHFGKKIGEEKAKEVLNANTTDTFRLLNLL